MTGIDFTKKPLRHVSELWQDYLKLSPLPPVEGTEEWYRQKVAFFSGIILFIGYSKEAFPVVKATPTVAEKKIYQAQLQTIYDDARKVLEQLVIDKLNPQTKGNVPLSKS